MLAKKGILLSLSAYVQIAVGIIPIMILSRALGPEGVGQLTLFRQTCLLGAQIASCGLASGMIGTINHKGVDRSLAFVSVLWFVIPPLIVSAAIVCLLYYSMPDYFGVYSPLIYPAIFISVVLFYIKGAHVSLVTAIQDVRRIICIELVPRVLFALFIGIVFVCASSWLTIERVVLAEGCALSALGTVIAVLLCYRLVSYSTRPRFAVIRSTLPLGLQITLSDIVLTLNGYTIITLLKYFSSSFTQVGYFSRGLSVASLAVIAFTASVRLLYSRWAELKGDELRRSVHNTINFATTVGVVSGIVVALFAHPIVLILFGAEFLPAVPVVRVLLIGTIVFVIANLLQSLFTSDGRAHANIVVFGVGVVMHAAIGLLLVPRYEAMGAALTTLLANSVMVSVAVWLAKKRYGVSIKAMLIPSPRLAYGIIRSLVSRGRRKA